VTEDLRCALCEVLPNAAASKVTALAVAEVDLLRVRSAREHVIRTGVEAYRLNEKRLDPNDPYDLEALANAMALKAEALVRIDEYERRALSQRKYARRALLDQV
jgi:predicted nucleic acid-binding protein